MSDTSEHLQGIADACDEVALFAEYLKFLAGDQTEKANTLTAQIDDQHNWAAIYRTAASSAE